MQTSSFKKISLIFGFIFVLAFPAVVSAAVGEGSATIDIQGEGSAGASQNVQISGNYDIVIVLTVGASGIAADGENIRITVPAGWTAPQSTTATAAGYVTVTSSAGTVAIGTIAGQAVSLNVTGALSSGNTVTFRYGNKTSGPGALAPATATGATEFIVATDDTGANALTEINGGTSPTVRVYGTTTLTTGANTPSQAIGLAAINKAIGQFSVTAAGEAMTVTDVIVDVVNNSGSDFPATRFANLRIIQDATAGGDYDVATDTTQCSATKSSVSSLQNITFDCDVGGSNISVPSGTTVNFFLVADMTASWVVGDTARASMDTATDIVATGGTSGVTSVNATATLPVQGNILHAYNFNKQDQTPPPLPTELTVQFADDLKSIKVTWKNSAATDVYRIYLLRSKNSPPINSAPYRTFTPEVTEFTDTDFATTDQVYYALIVDDVSGNASVLSPAVQAKRPGVLTPPQNNGTTTPEVIPPAGEVGGEATPEGPGGEGEQSEEIPFPFRDVPEDYPSRAAIEKVFAEGVMDGKTTTRFFPKNKLRRGEAAVILANVLKLETEKPARKPFRDVSTSSKYAGAVAALKNVKIIEGRSSQKFRPGAYITKGEFAVLLLKTAVYRGSEEEQALYLNLLGKPVGGGVFEDLTEEIPEAPFILALRARGIYPVYKKSGKKVSLSKTSLRRDRAAEFLVRAFYKE